MSHGPAFGTVQELREARARMSIMGVWVAEEYRLDAGTIQPVSDGEPISVQQDAPGEGRWYAPMGRPELPAELAKVADEREETLRAFVHRYGLLGQLDAILYDPARRLPWTRVDGETIRARVRRQIAEATRDARRLDRALWRALWGDSVAWTVAHARTVRLVLELARALAKPELLRPVLDGITDSDGAVVRCHVGHGSTHGSRAWSRRLLGQTPDGQARRLIVDLLNPNLQSVHQHLSFADDERALVVSLEAPGMLGYVYRHLADAVLAGQVRECAYSRCRRLFVATDERMKYCPPPLGVGDVSPCMNRSKVAAARARARHPGAARQQRKRNGGGRS